MCQYRCWQQSRRLFHAKKFMAIILISTLAHVEETRRRLKCNLITPKIKQITREHSRRQWSIQK